MNNVGNDLAVCSGCGLCQGICPVDAIRLKKTEEGVLRPEIASNCVECGKCVSVCPTRTVEQCSYKDYEYVVYGHSLDDDLRKEAASGGVTTELLSYLLSKKYVDYVVTANENHCDGIVEGGIFTKGVQLFQRSGSNYCPVNMGKLIRQIKERDGQCAIVCLPCLARGIAKARKTDKQLDKKIKYVICLLCNHVPSYNATEYLIKRYKIERPDLVKYRGNGWFGYFRAYKTDKTAYAKYFEIAYAKYFETAFAKYFWQESCVECVDHFGKYADICMGDADFVKYRNPNESNLGETICFSNNDTIIGILNSMSSEGKVKLYDDMSEKELEWIYGPLCDEHRASKENLKSNYLEIVHDEVWQERKRYFLDCVYKARRMASRVKHTFIKR